MEDSELEKLNLQIMRSVVEYLFIQRKCINLVENRVWRIVEDLGFSNILCEFLRPLE